MSSPPLAPTTTRIDALDVVRGVAILGILLMNIRYMGAPIAGQGYPPMLGWTTADQTVWWVKWVTRIETSPLPWWAQSPFPLT